MSTVQVNPTVVQTQLVYLKQTGPQGPAGGGGGGADIHVDPSPPVDPEATPIWLDTDEDSNLVTIDETPVDGHTTQGISSDWAYDHEQAANPHPNRGGR